MTGCLVRRHPVFFAWHGVLIELVKPSQGETAKHG